MTRLLDTLPPLYREFGAYLLLGCLAVYALGRLFQDAMEGRDHG